MNKYAIVNAHINGERPQTESYGRLPYFVGGYGTLEVTKSQWGNPKSIHMELRVEMSNEGYYHKMADINLIEE